MWNLGSARALLGLSVFVTAHGVLASDIVVGGLQNWNMGLKYDQVNASIGDALVFKFDRGQHDVWQVRGPSCNFNGSRKLAGLGKGYYSVRLTKPGMYFFSCSVEGHCQSGMLLSVNVSGVPRLPTDPTPDSPANPVYMPAGPQVGNGSCSAPQLVEGTNDTYTTQCTSVGWPMNPGDVVNAFYEMPMPYPPNSLVTTVSQHAGIVDSTGRPVPLSEIYVHHFFGDYRNVRAEGAEIRGSLTKKPLPAPYGHVFNSSVLLQPSSRASNVHIINTKGVPPMNLYPCVECWCRDQPEWLKKLIGNKTMDESDAIGSRLSNVTVNGRTRVEALSSAAERLKSDRYRGGTACCTAEQCLSTLPPEPTVYHLQYNITYRLVQDPATIVPASLYILDLVNGTIEYDVIRSPGIDFDVVETFGAFDERCPQPDNFTLLRCTGHQHIGGACMELYDADTDALICRSCPVYGNGTSLDELGNEAGYLVKMMDDTLATPLVMRPGQRVRLVSRYDASTDHYGVMSLFFTEVTHWDETCSGTVQPVVTTFGPPQTRSTGTFFGYTVPLESRTGESS
eukprot:jgi/Botrbrau1/17978/Bobra.50_1s0067.1